MIWPEKKEITFSTGNLDTEYCIGWNAAIEACKKAYDKEQDELRCQLGRLLALDENKLMELLIEYDKECYPEDWKESEIETTRMITANKDIVKNICSKLGSPSTALTVRELDNGKLSNFIYEESLRTKEQCNKLSEKFISAYNRGDLFKEK